MVVLGGDRCLDTPPEPTTAAIARDRLGKYFDRHIATEVGVRRLIHLTHAAFADLGSDLIRAEAGAEGQGQFVPYYAGESECGRGRSCLTVPIQPVDATVSASVTAGVR